MINKASLKIAFSCVALLLAELLQADGKIDGHIIQVGVGGSFAYITIKLVLDYLRSKDNAVHDKRIDDAGMAFSRELVTVLADIKQGLNEGRREAHSQHEQQIKLLTELVTRLRMRD